MKISVITITHNRAHLIAETISSVLAQSHADWEHIIIDDGSTDETENVIRSFNDERIRYYKYPKSATRSYLRNEAIRKADGALISILDSDDIWDKDKLAAMVGIFNENPDVDFVFHDLAQIRNGQLTDDVFFDYPPGILKTALAELLQHKLLPFPVFTIRKNALEKIGLLDETMIDGQQDLYLRAASQLVIYYYDKKLTVMKKHGQNISSVTDMTQYDDYLKAVKKLQVSGALSRKDGHVQMSKIYHKMGYIYRSRKDYGLAKTNYRSSFSADLLNIHGIKSAIMYLKTTLTR